MRWVFYANSDWTETEINELKGDEQPPAKSDTNGAQFSFVHVFEADDWDTAMLQIKRLRYGMDGDLLPGDMERAKGLLRQLPSQAPEGSVNWSLAMNAVIHSFAGIRSE